MKAVLFDLDGTLLDTVADLAAAVNFALERQGYPTHSVERVRTFINHGMRVLCRRALPATAPTEAAERLYADFFAYYLDHATVHTRPYDGIPAMLQALQAAGIRCAVVSNKGQAATERLVAHYFPGLFASVIGAREGVALKPAPDALLSAMAELGVAKEDCVYVGDSGVDLETARAAGIPCLSVDYGMCSHSELAALGASEILSGAPALLARLLG